MKININIYHKQREQGLYISLPNPIILYSTITESVASSTMRMTSTVTIQNNNKKASEIYNRYF